MASNVRATTQNHLDIEDVIQNLILLKDGSCAIVIETNAINFGLLSEEEQDATIYAYAAFLNSLTFSIQILIRSDVKDISNYLRLLEEQEVKQSNPLKKQQIKSYKQFITGLIKERNVLEKKFYIAIPFSYLELGLSKSLVSGFSSNKTLPFDKSYIVEKARSSLEPKRDHVARQLGRIGLGARQLNTQELIQLLFAMYNPSSAQGQKISNAQDYTTPLVQPAYIRQETPPEPQVNQPLPQPTNDQFQTVPTPNLEQSATPQAPIQQP